MEQFYNVYLAAKSASEETVQLQKKVESRQVEDERLEAEDEVLTELGLEINESETTFAGSDNSMDVNGQINNLKKIVQQSAIGQNDDFVNAAESTCNEIRSGFEIVLKIRSCFVHDFSCLLFLIFSPC